MGKPSCRTVDEKTGKDHFKGHAAVSVEKSVSVMKRLKLDNDTINNVKKLVEYHDYRPRLTMPNVRRAIVKIGPERMKMLFAVKRADTMAQSEYMREDKLAYIKEFEEKFNQVIEDGDCISLKQLAVGGSDLIEAGMEAGPKLGEILNVLFEHVLDVPKHNTKEFLLDYCKGIIL